MTLYDQWVITRWETPVSEIDRLALVSLTDCQGELTLLLEAPWSPGRPRWQVKFDAYPAYRNIDESYRVALWKWLDDSRQRCGSTFLVREPEPQASWGTEYLHIVYPDIQHFVIATLDDVVEVLSTNQPDWQIVEPPTLDEPAPGKANHLFSGEDDSEIERIKQNIQTGKGNGDFG